MNVEALFLGVFGGVPYTWDDAFEFDYHCLACGYLQFVFGQIYMDNCIALT